MGASLKLESALQWQCSECPKGFTRKGDLTRHRNIHTGYKPYQCEYCPRAFLQRSGLKAHINTHTKEKPHPCDFAGCDKVFGDASSRTRHSKEKHRCLGSFSCPQCNSRIKRRSAFTTHLRVKHGLTPSKEYIDSLAPNMLPAPFRRGRRRAAVEEPIAAPLSEDGAMTPSIKIDYVYAVHDQDIWEAVPPIVSASSSNPPTWTSDNSVFTFPTSTSFPAFTYKRANIDLTVGGQINTFHTSSAGQSSFSLPYSTNFDDANDPFLGYHSQNLWPIHA